MAPRFPDPARALASEHARLRAAAHPSAYDIVLLDLDGTLTDSAPGIIAALAHAFRETGLSVPSEAELHEFVGPPIHVSLPNHGVPAEIIPDFMQAYRSAYSGGLMFRNSVYPGIPRALTALRDGGVSRLVVATSKPEHFAIEIIQHLQLAPLLDAVYGATLDDSRSSKADVVAYALQSEEAEAGTLVPLTRIVMVGDRQYDVAGAHANGLAVIGVSWGYANDGELTTAGADLVVDSADALVTAIVGT